MTMNALISKFQPISLSEMGGIKLMNRTDTKFVTSIDKLMQLLQMAGDEYRVQEIDGKRNMSYATIYYDSKDYAFYNAHHDGHAGRQKVRVRSYVDSHLSFLEIKTKDNHGKTYKSRISADDALAQDFLKQVLLTTGKKCSLPRLAIIELKRDGLQPSPILPMLRELRIHPGGFSKYCIGEALTNPSLRINRMKPRLQQIKKIS